MAFTLSRVLGTLDDTVRDIEMLEFVDFVKIECVIFTLSCAAVSWAHWMMQFVIL